MKPTAQAWQEYRALCHAMQSGVAYEHGHGSDDGTPKHLRVGVNVALCDHSALVTLLIAKGVLTEQEYANACLTAMTEEVARYEARANAGRAGPLLHFS